MLNQKFISGKEASKILGVHQRTLYIWEKKKYIEVIRSPGGKRFYNIHKYLKKYNHNNLIKKKNDKKKSLIFVI